MLFKPDKYPAGNYKCESLDGATRSGVYFTALDGSRLHGWLFRKRDAKKVVLYNHGNAGNLTYRLGIARLLLETGVSLFLYDYRGYGSRESTPSLRDILQNSLRAH